jgi:hypothetical protein
VGLVNLFHGRAYYRLHHLRPQEEQERVHRDVPVDQQARHVGYFRFSQEIRFEETSLTDVDHFYWLPDFSITIEAALPATITSIGFLATFVNSGNTDLFILFWEMFHPKMYILPFIAVLNSRTKLRREGGGSTQGTGGSTDGHGQHSVSPRGPEEILQSHTEADILGLRFSFVAGTVARNIHPEFVA